MSGFESVGFVGGGRVTRFLLEGWRRAGRLPADVVVSDPDEKVLTALQSEFMSIRVGDNQTAGGASLVVLAVHPPAMAGVLSGLRGVVSAGAAVLSLAPKIRAETIQSALDASAVVRMIPNAPSAIGRGYNPVSYASGFDPELKARLASVFAPWGHAPEVPEADLEAYAILSAMGPTYFWFQLQTLRELAAEFGLAPEAADAALRHMAVGAVDLLLAGGFAPASVLDMVPVRPLKDDEAAIVAAYKARLPALFAKIRP